jgi:ubiquinone/menaquinone biosynthesis C-methylase UbiE
MSKEHESNRQAWNEAATYYQKHLEASLELLQNGGSALLEVEARNLKKFCPKIQKAIHLQCAGGTDSLSLLNLGAEEVIGIDISEEMLKVAKTKSERLKMNATWVHADALKVPAELNGSADLVYTGKGAINWIMDIGAWAHVVARLLKPRGVLFLFEGHPLTYIFEMKASELTLDSSYKGYFASEPYISQDWPETYVGKVKSSESEQAKKYERAWPVSSVITALLEAGLKLELFAEHPDKYWEEFPNLPQEKRQFFPNTYTVIARKL